MVRICLYVYVRVAPPMIVGAWSMAVMLWQLYEYCYTYSQYYRVKKIGNVNLTFLKLYHVPLRHTPKIPNSM